MEPTSTTLQLIANYGYVVIFIIVAIENIEFFGSFPTSLIAAGMGALASQGVFDPTVSIILLVIASIVGDIVGYWIGWKFGRVALLRWAKHLVTKNRLERAEQIVSRWGVVSVFFTRFIVASIQAIVNIIAGITRMRFISFFFAALVGEFIWTLIYFFLGYFAWPRVEGILSKISLVGPLGAILTLTVIMLVYYIIRIRKKT